MTKSKTTKRALLSSCVALMLCFSMLLGTTYAWFTDSATTGSNVIQAGTLDIVLEYWDGDSWEDAEGKVLEFKKGGNYNGIVGDVLWEPGCTYELPKIRVRNEGNLAAYVVLRLNGVTGDEKLMEAIKLQTTVTNIPESILNGSQASAYAKYDDEPVDLIYGTPDGTVIFDWSLMGKDHVSSNSGHTDTSAEFTISGHMDEEAGNEYQGLMIEGVSITALATQQVYEYDSFDRYYDQDAEFPNVTVVKNTAELADAIADGVSEITLAGGTYQMPDAAKGKTLTISGSHDTIIEVVPAGQGEANGQLDYSLDGSTVTFNGVTIKTNSQLYAGYARLSATYNNCVIQNTYNLGTGNSEFNNCVFNITNEYLRVGGAYSAAFNGCTFNTDGRAILVFQDGTSVKQTVTVKDCTFNATAAANTWNGIHVAAVSIDGTSGTYVVNLEGTNTADSNFNGLWQIKAGEANVTVNE